MSIIARGRAFLQVLRQLTSRSASGNPPCPHCHSDATWKHGHYTRQVRALTGTTVRIMPRYRCAPCGKTFSAPQPDIAPHRWYGRDVQRLSIDLWLHGGVSLRSVALFVRSLAGHQDRWTQWRPWERPLAPDADRLRLHAATVHRWLAGAGRSAEARTPSGWTDVPSPTVVGVDGLWARLVGGTKAVVLLLRDTATGFLWPPVVTAGEHLDHWQTLVHQVEAAGLDPATVRGLTSDGAAGVAALLHQTWTWVHHQRCVFHLWRGLATPLATAAAEAAQDLVGAAAQARRRAVRRTLRALVRAVFDAPSWDAAQAALATLAAHDHGAALARALAVDLEAAVVYQLPWVAGLSRVGPETPWRDFRLRVSRGRNHRSATRLGRAAALWALYHNFEPAQVRCERTRHYRHPGLSPLTVAGVDPGAVSYLDALGI